MVSHKNGIFFWKWKQPALLPLCSKKRRTIERENGCKLASLILMTISHFPRTLRLLFWNFIWIDNVFLLRSYSQVTFKDDGLRGIEVQCPQKWIYPFEKACREKKLSGKLVNMLPTFISRWLMRVYKCVARKCYPRSDTLLLHELLDSRVKYSIYFWPKNRPFKNHRYL